VLANSSAKLEAAAGNSMAAERMAVRAKLEDAVFMIISYCDHICQFVIRSRVKMAARREYFVYFSGGPAAALLQIKTRPRQIKVALALTALQPKQILGSTSINTR
jgi:hypothetical protein